jgi:hypothetical protein
LEESGRKMTGTLLKESKNTMKKQRIFAKRSFIIASLLSSMLAGAVYAAETNSCLATCAADLKECRKQVDLASNLEAHPILVDSSTKSRYTNEQANTLMNNKVLPTSQNDEVQKRRMERNQKCETDNSTCLNQCSSAPAPKRNSVIFK